MADFLDILISRFRFLSSSEKLLLRDVCGSSEVLLGMSVGDIESVTGRRHKIMGYTVEKAVDDAHKAQKILAAGTIKCLFLGEPGYPAQLADIYNPPYIIYYRGSLPDWADPAVAVVGTRLASGNGLDAAFELGFDFGKNGLPVVSGLAMGIDCAAHLGTVAGGGRTIAVLGCGPDRIYPAANRNAAAKILENGGAVVSEYLPGETPLKHHFPERNRLISGLSRAVIVVEAPGKSGALITADFALEQGRDLFIHEAALKSSARRERLERMIFDGAPVIGNACSVLEDWGLTAGRLRKDPIDLEIAMTSEEAGFSLAEALNDELKGYKIRFNGNYFRRACYESSYSINS